MSYLLGQFDGSWNCLAIDVQWREKDTQRMRDINDRWNSTRTRRMWASDCVFMCVCVPSRIRNCCLIFFLSEEKPNVIFWHNLLVIEWLEPLNFNWTHSTYNVFSTITLFFHVLFDRHIHICVAVCALCTHASALEQCNCSHSTQYYRRVCECVCAGAKPRWYTISSVIWWSGRSKCLFIVQWANKMSIADKRTVG